MRAENESLDQGPAPVEGGGNAGTGGTAGREGSEQPTATAGPLTDRNAAGPAGVAPQDLAGVAPPVTGTRTAATWAALAAGLFGLIVVLVFILQNLKSTRVHFFWATWSVPLAVDLLLATVLGALVMFTAGSLRILQLRRSARSARRLDKSK